MSNTVKIEVMVRTNKVGSDCRTTVEYDREEWESMTEEQREQEAKEVMWNMTEWNWQIVEG